MRKAIAVALGLALLAFVPVISAQSVSGNISGTVTDKSGSLVPKASVTVSNPETGFTKTLTANEQGEFLFTDLLPGSYDITVTAAGFAKATLTRFPVQLNRTNSVAVVLDVESHKVTVEVSGTAPPINTSTPQIEGTFESKETAMLPTATLGGFTGLGVLNLALLQPGVSSSGGVGQGTGPAVGGQRPTNNSFTIEGVDNNLKYSTGPNVYVPNDSVQEFSALQNQFSPEFGHSNGGQFNQVIKTGTNTFHGMLYDYTQNRYLNATDQLAVVDQVSPQRPRLDLNRVGGQLGGPILKDKLFFFASGEYSPLGQAALPPGGVCAPTAAGYAQIMALPPGLSPDGATTVSVNMTNVGVLQQFLGTAQTGGNCVGTQGNPNFTTAGGTRVTNPLYICTGGAPPSGSTCTSGIAEGIDVGNLPITAPSFENVYALVTAVDYNISDKDQLRVRYIYNRTTGLDNLASLPIFFEPSPIHNHLVAINEYHTFRPDLTNELRLGYNRYYNFTTAGNFTFPGLDQFPNLLFLDGLNVQVGPDSNAPSFTIQNTYQASENLSWTYKNHNVRTGVEIRRYIEPTDFIQRARGDYDYTSTGLYLYDINPDFLAQRSVGTFRYYGDNIDTAWYVNDVWRILPSFSLNLGVRYEYATIPQGARIQQLNNAATVPGVLNFSEPRAPKNQFMPRLGFAWSPDAQRTWVVRGGWSMGYDVVFDNLPGNITSTGDPPTIGTTVDVTQGSTPASVINNFLANGGIPNVIPPFMTVVEQQQATTGHIQPNWLNPVAITASLGVQHEFAKNYTVDVTYIYTHGYHLSVQTRPTRQVEISPTNFIPTFLTTPTAAQLAGLTVTPETLAGPATISGAGVNSYVPSYVAGCAAVTGAPADASPCFSQPAFVEFSPEGTSVYHGLATQLTRRFSHGLQFSLAYTFSHDIDNSTASLATTTLTPRRPQDFQDLADDRSNSALDHRHRVSLMAYYDLPYFKSGSWLKRNVLGNWMFVPVFTFQSGGWGDLQSSLDVNGNGDSAGDRVLIHAAGAPGVGTTVTATCLIGGIVVVGSDGMGNSCNPSNTVAYTAANPDARYIRSGAGGLIANNGLVVAGRNTIQMRPIDNLDFTVAKKFDVTERVRFELQAQFLNLLNHPQYVPGSINTVNPVLYQPGTGPGVAVQGLLTPGNALFGHPEQVFSSNPRIIQLGAKLTF